MRSEIGVPFLEDYTDCGFLTSSFLDLPIFYHSRTNHILLLALPLRANEPVQRDSLRKAYSARARCSRDILPIRYRPDGRANSSTDHTLP